MKTLDQQREITSKPLVFSFSGSKGSGKDTAAEHIFRCLKEKGLQVRRTSFAGALYDEVSQAFGIAIPVILDRKFKDSPQFEMALANCTDKEYISKLPCWFRVFAVVGLRVNHLRI